LGAAIYTLGYVKKLTAVGVSREQAEAHAEALRDDLASQVVTKIDLAATEQRLDGKVATMEAVSEAKSHCCTGWSVSTSRRQWRSCGD
jgi:GTPase